MAKKKTARKKPAWRPVRTPLPKAERGRSDLELEIRESISRIAKERDILRILVDDADAILESTDEALLDLESAADQLSTTV